MTPLDVLIEALEAAARYDPDVQARPEAVVWCDPDATFAPIMPMLRARMPRVHTLGDHDPTTRTTPAFALRLATAQAEAAGEPPPILWLPDVGRETLRAPGSCPEPLEPLAWLAVAGSLFGHVNGKDWNLRAFLTAERGPLRLSIADGAEAKEALALAAPHLFTRPTDALAGQHYDAEKLHALCAPDVAADMLEWMEGRLIADADAARFKAFALRATKDLAFDPRKRSREDAVLFLAGATDSWAGVWNRFQAGTGEGYPGILQLLKATAAPGGLFEQNVNFPSVNERAEAQVRTELLGLSSLSPSVAAERLIELETAHSFRRGGVWARRGEAPLACALEGLSKVARAAPWPLVDAEGLARHHVAHGAGIDGAALAALAAAPGEPERAAVTAALQSAYRPWVDAGCNALQALAERGEVPFGKVEQHPAEVAMVFVDGLRFDLAQQLVGRLEAQGARAILDWRWSGFPTSTASCKPLVSPVADLLTGAGGEDDGLPRTPDGRVADHTSLRRLMKDRGFSFDESDAGRLWIETGTFDEDGHKLGGRLANQVAQGIEDAAQCILRLARAGRKVRVVTDHGWLLMPGGLPKATLGAGLTDPDEKRTRYARLKPGATTNHAQAAWSWNREVRLAMAPGASSFYAGYEYAHGGVSPQECVVPLIDVEPLSAPRHVEIVSVEWRGLRLRVEASGAADLRIDLRLPTDLSGEGLLPEARRLDEEGRGSVPVPDDYEGQAAVLVVLDDDGHIVARASVTVGG